MPLESAQLNTAIQNALQSYSASEDKGGISDTASLFTSILQEKLSEQSFKSVANSFDGTQSSASGSDGALESILPMLLMNGVMSGSSSEATGSLMTALIMALSSETGRKQLGGLGSELSSVQSNGTSAYSAAQSAYLKGKATSAAGSADGTVGKAGTADKAKFDRSANLISNAGNRSAQLYRAIIEGFDVENNPKYQPRNGGTFCNIYQQDVTEAMGAAIPHCVNTKTGAPTTNDDPDMMYMNANRTSDWLNKYGEQYGWYEVSAEQAQRLANQGHPAVTIWKNNSGGHGHCQIVSPSESGDFDPQRGVAISQAGRRLMNYSYISNVYSASLPEVQYFAHK